MKYLWYIALLALPVISNAANLNIPAVTVTSTPGGGENYSVSLQILIFMTLLSVLPGLLMAMTAFTRIMIVMSILRQAIGMAQTPTNQILIGLSLFLTFFVMSPVFTTINNQALQPYLNDKITMVDALQKAQQPLRNFMLNQKSILKPLPILEKKSFWGPGGP